MTHEGAFFMDDSYLEVHSFRGNLINDTILQKAGFVRSNVEIEDEMQDEYPGFRTYEKYISSGKFIIDVTFGISNIDNNKNWIVHIDNCDRMSIGAVDISTIGQFNDFMKLLNIDCKL